MDDMTEHTKQKVNKIEYWKATWSGPNPIEYYCALPDGSFMYYHPGREIKEWRPPHDPHITWKQRKKNLPDNRSKVEKLEIILMCGSLCPDDKG